MSLTQVPFPTPLHDLALSVALNSSFQTPLHLPRLQMAQMFARLKMVQWLQEGLAVPVLAKSFEEAHELYKP